MANGGEPDGKVVIEIDAEASGLEKELDGAEKKVKKFGSSSEDVSQKIDDVSASASGLASTVMELREDISDTASGVSALGEQMDKAGESTTKLGDEQDKTSDSTDGLGKKTKETEEKTKRYSDTQEDAAKKTEAFSESTLTLAASTAVVEAALLKAYTQVIATASAYESAEAKLLTIADTAAVAGDELSASVLQLSQDTAMAAGDVAEAAYQAISGSVDTADAVTFVSDANKLAVAGFTSLSNATDVLTTTLNSYKLSADSVAGISNVLINTQNLGKTSVDLLASSMGRAIATGSAYGVDLQNISTAYVELTRGGIATAEATTYLSGMFNELGNATSKVGTIISEKTGKSFGQLMSDGYSLADILQILSDSVNGDSEALMGLWGSQEAGKAANAIMSQSVEDFNHVLADMNVQMSGTASTTDDAYATMTSTSAFIDQKLSNSFENLCIAIGDDLNPVVSALKEGLTWIIDGITEIVNEHPVVTSVLTGAGIALATFSAIVGIYTLKAKLATVATAALTAAMNANPYILAATAIAGLATLITVLIANSKTGSSAVSDMKDEVKELNETMAEAQVTAEQSIATAEATARTADMYIDKLEDLEATGLKTDAQQREWHNTLVLLSQTVPELSDLIDLNTDSIEGGTAALRENVDAWIENAKAQAYQDYLAASAKALADAEIALQDTTIKLTDAQIKLKDNEKEQHEVQAEMNRLWNDAVIAAEEYEKQTGLVVGADTMLSDSYFQLKHRMTELKDENKALTGEIDDCTEAISIGQKAVDEASAEMNNTEKVVRDLTNTTNAGTEAENEYAEAKKSATAACADAEEELLKLQEAYDAAYSSAYSAVTGMYNLWDEADTKTTMSVSNMNAALQSQIDYWQTYSANIANLSSRNIEGLDAMVAAYNDGSKEGNAAIAALAAATDKELETMVADYQALMSAQGDAITSSAEMESGYSKNLEDVADDMKDMVDGMDLSEDAAAAAKSTIDAYVNQLSDGKIDAAEAAAGIRRAVLDAIGTVTVTVTAFDGGGYSYGYNTKIDARYASGTSAAASGYALVGEDGPEIVLFRGGETVIPADTTERILSARPVPMPVSPDKLSAGRKITVIVPLSIDGREFARATADDIGEEMYWRTL